MYFLKPASKLLTFFIARFLAILTAKSLNRFEKTVFLSLLLPLNILTNKIGEFLMKISLNNVDSDRVFEHRTLRSVGGFLLQTLQLQQTVI